MKRSSSIYVVASILSSLRETVRGLLDRRDWAYLLSLLVPLVLYNLALKGIAIASREEVDGILGTFNLIRSDLLFNLGYASLWVGLFAVVRKGVYRKGIVVLFHAVSILIVLVTASAHQYFLKTGSTLDYSTIIYYLGTLGEIKSLIAREATPVIRVLLLALLAYMVLGPFLVKRAVGRRTPRQVSGGSTGALRFGAFVTCLVAAGLVLLSALPGAAKANKSFSRSPFVNAIVTGLTGPDVEELTAGISVRYEGNRLVGVGLRQTPETEKRNVVLIHLESIRARSMTPYEALTPSDQDSGVPPITPFMAGLAEESLLVERSYTIIPHTSKALVAVNCGINPHPDKEILEAEPGRIPVPCLPDLLKRQDYNSVFFQSATETFEDRPQLVKNFGYEDFYGLEDMSTEGFEQAGFLGYEDAIMLEPSRRWLEENGDEPFLASYVTLTSHYEYLAPDRYGYKEFAEDEELNRYLNSVRYVDSFLKELFEQYKELGLYEDTIFVLYGDHGEAFAEHGVKKHDKVIYEEALRIPLMVHDPQRWQEGERVEDILSNQLDIVPTVLEMLGYEVVGGEYPGYSLLEPLLEDRTLHASCRPDLLCAASIKGYEKHIYHYGRRPGELYDLREDPLEERDLIREQNRNELKKWRSRLLEWRARAITIYEGPTSQSQ